METISLIYLFSFALVILFIIFLFLVRRSIKLGGKLEITRTQLLVAEEEVEKYREKYAKVIDIETECEQIKKQLESDKKEIEDKERKTLHEIELKRDEAITNRQLAEQQIRDLKSDYITKKATYDSLTRQIAIFSEDIELIELGFMNQNSILMHPKYSKKK